jgi:hypothetical protein
MIKKAFLHLMKWFFVIEETVILPASFWFDMDYSQAIIVEHKVVCNVCRIDCDKHGSPAVRQTLQEEYDIWTLYTLGV